MPQKQRVTIALLALFVLWCGWQSRLSSDHPPANENAKTNAEQSGGVIATKQSENKLTDWLLVLFNGLLFGSTVLLWRSGEKMWRTTNKTVSLMREDMTNTHRPRLRIRNVIVQQPQDALGKKWPRFHRGHVVRGQFYIVNVGSGRADILDGHCTVLWTQDGLPMARPYEGAGDNLNAAGRTLLSGESTLVIFENEKMVGEEGSTFGMRTILGHNFYVMGWVTYSDRNNNVRRTAFCREYFKNKGPNDEFVGGDGRFFPVNNPDYEHEE
jgi:hypothetical protein